MTQNAGLFWAEFGANLFIDALREGITHEDLDRI